MRGKSLEPTREVSTEPLRMLKSARLRWVRACWRERLLSAESGSGAEEEARRYLVWPQIAEFADFERWRGRRVLELGGDSGIDGVNFARAGANYTSYVGTEKAADVVRDRFAEAGVIGTIEAGEPLGGRDVEKFDLIYAWDSMGVAEFAAFSSERLAATGELRLMVPAKASWRDALVQAGTAPENAESIACGRGEVRKLLSGFDVLQIDQAGLWPYQRTKAEAGVFELEPWFASMPPELVTALDERFGACLLIRACRAGAREQLVPMVPVNWLPPARRALRAGGRRGGMWRQESNIRCSRSLPPTRERCRLTTRWTFSEC